ncbi:MAG: S-layer homology domain-containing protein [Clostridiales bacterium]|nr:S-layer homology domain-containing protein [Clostridiales bacterium]
MRRIAKRLFSLLLALSLMLSVIPGVAGALPEEGFRWAQGAYINVVLSMGGGISEEGGVYEWEIVESDGFGPLPDGLSLTPYLGTTETVFQILGTPTTLGAGSVKFHLAPEGELHQSSNYGYDYILNYEIFHEHWLVFNYDDNPAALPAGKVGADYSAQILAESCGTPIVFSHGSGELPPGLSLSNSGLLSGVPTAEGTFTFQVNANVNEAVSAGVSTNEAHIARNSHGFIVTIGPADTTPEKITVTAWKTDENGAPLAGATLRMEGITAAGARKVYSEVSDANGLVTFEVEPGTYTLYEYAAPAGYNATDDSYPLLVWDVGPYIDRGPSWNPDRYQPVTFVNRKIPELNKKDHFAYMAGYPDGTFGAVRNMTRAEAVVMFSRLLNESMALDKDYRSFAAYPDISRDAWYAGPVGFMHQLGVLADYTRGGPAFRPDEPVTRAEFATLAAHFDNLTLTSTNQFTDVASDHWAVKYINSAAAKGWIVGYSDNTFKPEANITRAEVVTLVNRILERTADEAYVIANAAKLPRSYTDVDRSNWAYFTIIEASIGHDYMKQGAGEVWTAVYD